MSESISNTYNTLLTGWNAQQASLPNATTAAPAASTVPVAPVDQMALSAPPSAAVMPQVMSPADVRAELAALQGELLKLNQKIESLMQRVDAMPPAAATPQPAATPPVQVPPAPAAAAPVAAGSHDVKAGDYLWKIAHEKLGDATRWPEIYALNRDVIGDNPNLLQPGQKLRLPAPAGVPTANNPVATTPPPTATNPVATTPPPLPTAPPQLPPAAPVLPPPPPPVAPMTGTQDIPTPKVSNRTLSDQDALRVGTDFGLLPRNAALTPEGRANVARFLDEMDAYQTTERGKVFGPGIEDIAANPQEVQQIRASVRQIQQALDLLIKAGKLRVSDAQGRAISGIAASGSFFKLDAQGREQKDAAGNPILDEAFIQAVVRFKQDQGIHQSYKMPDGKWAVNEYVGPATVEALKKALLQIQRG